MYMYIAAEQVRLGLSVSSSIFVVRLILQDYSRIYYFSSSFVPVQCICASLGTYPAEIGLPERLLVNSPYNRGTTTHSNYVYVKDFFRPIHTVFNQTRIITGSDEL